MTGFKVHRYGHKFNVIIKQPDIAKVSKDIKIQGKPLLTELGNMKLPEEDIKTNLLRSIGFKDARTQKKYLKRRGIHQWSKGKNSLFGITPVRDTKKGTVEIGQSRPYTMFVERGTFGHGNYIDNNGNEWITSTHRRMHLVSSFKKSRGNITSQTHWEMGAHRPMFLRNGGRLIGVALKVSPQHATYFIHDSFEEMKREVPELCNKTVSKMMRKGKRNRRTF